MSIQPGQKLGNYSILRSIGRGGFAEVYLGQHIYLNTYAAIKVLQARMTQNDFVSFKAEAQTIANLTHPHIVRVLEFGKEEDLPFLVMDYCPDGTLRKRHPRGTSISLVECVGYVKQVAAALQYAHDMKVIHRDIKPENMLSGKDGLILLSDFGIAIAAQSSHYQSGQNMGGTLVYMAPEQFDGKATFASDQYALGVVVYEWLSGEAPFTGSPREIIAQQFKGRLPSLRTKVAGLSATVELVVQKALAPDPEQRFESVQAFAEALEQARQGNMPGTLNDRDHIIAQSTTPTEEEEPDSSATIPPIPSGGTLPAAPAGKTLPATPGRYRSYFSPSASAYESTESTLPDYMPSGPMGPAPYDYSTPSQPLQKSNSGRYIAIIVVLVIALLGTSILAVINIGSKFSASGKTTTTAGSNSSKREISATQTAVALKKRVPAKDGTFTKNIRLTCGGCNDPIVVTITTITVDSATGRMAWNLTLYNTTPNTYDGTEFNIVDFSLQEATNTNRVKASSDLMGTNLYEIPPEQRIAGKCVFSFIPYKKETYTLTSSLYAYPAGTIHFDPVSVTFS